MALLVPPPRHPQDVLLAAIVRKRPLNNLVNVSAATKADSLLVGLA